MDERKEKSFNCSVSCNSPMHCWRKQEKRRAHETHTSADLQLNFSKKTTPLEVDDPHDAHQSDAV